jgi:hypothetical protein
LDEFVERITAKAEPIEAGAWSDDEAKRAKASIRTSRKSW